MQIGHHLAAILDEVIEEYANSDSCMANCQTLSMYRRKYALVCQ